MNYKKLSFFIKKVATHDYFHTQLQENYPIHSVLEQGAKDYYKFTLSNTTSLKRMKFEITSIHGEVSMFLSKEEYYPDVNLHDY